jgi:uncharacterized membrane protein
MGSGAVWGLAIATFAAAAVEVVEAFTVVLAMGVTRSWRSALAGTAVALVGLAGFTAIAGYALVTWLPRSALQLTVGALLLIFGLQWLRKAILRSSGRKSLHDEDVVFRQRTAAALEAGDQRRFGLDGFSFVVSLKAVFLEGVEVVFIVITFGLNANNVPVAVAAAAAATVVVVVAGALLRAPLTRVPENTLKYGVGLMLATFGTYWAIEGLGAVRPGGASLRWPGGEAAILVLLAGWFLLSRALIALYRRPSGPDSRAPARTADLATEEV